MRPLSIGHLLPFPVKPIRASRLKKKVYDLYYRALYLTLHPRVLSKIISRSRSLLPRNSAILPLQFFFSYALWIGISLVYRTNTTKAQTVVRCLADPSPLCQSFFGLCDPKRAVFLHPQCTKFKVSTKQEIFDAPPSQMIPCISRGFI
jgi:hypothetical protein